MQINPQSNINHKNFHQCQECMENQSAVIRYKRLIELLYKKIRQLEKKIKIQNNQSQQHLQFKQNSEICISSTQLQKLASIMSQPSSLSLCQHSTIERLNVDLKNAKKDISSQRLLQKGKFQAHYQQKITGLTEQIMKAKTKIMHIRHCVYAFLKELNISDRIHSSSTALNITLALMSIFQFSQNQKEEMFNHKKIKLRKRQMGNKENIFVTIKQI